MATSAVQNVPLIEVYDYYLGTGSSSSGTRAPGRVGRTVKVTLQYDKAITIAPDPVTWIAQETVYTTNTDPNGFWHVYLVPNNKISPANTYYVVEIEGGPSYKIQVTDVAVPGVGWQSSAPGILLDIPAQLSPTTSTVGAITANGLITANAGILVTAGGLSVAGGVAVTGGETLTGGLTVDTITYSAAVARLIAGATSFAIRNSGNSRDNLLVTDAGNATVFADLTVGGRLVMSTAASKLVPGATSFSVRNNADGADNLLVSNAGLVTVRAGLVVTAGGLLVTAGGATITAGNLALTAGNLTFGAASAKIIPGATSLLVQNNADSATNLLLDNTGLATFRNALEVPPSAGAALPTHTYGTLTMEIESQTVTNVATITVPATGNLPTGFKHLRLIIKLRGLTAAASTTLAMKFSGDAGNNYGWQLMNASGAGAPTASQGPDAVGQIIVGTIAANTAPANRFGVIVVDIFDYNSTSDDKQVLTHAFWQAATGSGGMAISSGGGIWVSTAAITSITLVATAGNVSGVVTTEGVPG